MEIGTLVAAASPDELADAAEPEPGPVAVEEGLGVLLAILMDDESEAGLSKSFWFVIVAVNPVTFWQLELTVLFTPSTKLTGAH